METAAIDAIDREILAALGDNARMSFRAIGGRVGLSANAAAERVRRLERTGVVTGYRAVVDPSAGGKHLTALIDVRLEEPGRADEVEAMARSMGSVIEGAHVTGRFDYQFKVACANAAELDEILRSLKQGGAVVESDTRLVLRPL